jgi:hypothetical protein
MAPLAAFLFTLLLFAPTDILASAAKSGQAASNKHQSNPSSSSKIVFNEVRMKEKTGQKRLVQARQVDRSVSVAPKPTQMRPKRVITPVSPAKRVKVTHDTRSFSVDTRKRDASESVLVRRFSSESSSSSSSSQNNEIKELKRSRKLLKQIRYFEVPINKRVPLDDSNIISVPPFSKSEGSKRQSDPNIVIDNRNTENKATDETKPAHNAPPFTEKMMVPVSPVSVPKIPADDQATSDDLDDESHNFINPFASYRFEEDTDNPHPSSTLPTSANGVDPLPFSTAPQQQETKRDGKDSEADSLSKADKAASTAELKRNDSILKNGQQIPTAPPVPVTLSRKSSKSKNGELDKNTTGAQDATSDGNNTTPGKDIPTQAHPEGKKKKISEKIEELIEKLKELFRPKAEEKKAEQCPENNKKDENF